MAPAAFTASTQRSTWNFSSRRVFSELRYWSFGAGMPSTAEYRVDQLHDPIHRLRLVAAEHILELPLQRRSLLELRRVIGTPYPSTTANAEPSTKCSCSRHSVEAMLKSFSRGFELGPT